MSLEPDRVERLQKKLYEKAKQEPAFRFYSLYDKVCWAEILERAYRQAKANAGAAGVDGDARHHRASGSSPAVPVVGGRSLPPVPAEARQATGPPRMTRCPRSGLEAEAHAGRRSIRRVILPQQSLSKRSCCTTSRTPQGSRNLLNYKLRET